MIIGSSNSALNVEENTQQKCEGQTRKKRAANAKVAYSDHFSSRPYQKAKRGFKTAKITNKKVDAMCIKTALE